MLSARREGVVPRRHSVTGLDLPIEAVNEQLSPAAGPTQGPRAVYRLLLEPVERGQSRRALPPHSPLAVARNHVVVRHLAPPGAMPAPQAGGS